MNFLFTYPNGIGFTQEPLPAVVPPHLASVVQDILDNSSGDAALTAEEVALPEGEEPKDFTNYLVEREAGGFDPYGACLAEPVPSDKGEPDAEQDEDYFSAFPDDGRVPAGMPEDLMGLWDAGGPSAGTAEVPDISSLAASIGVRIDTTSRLCKAKVVKCVEDVAPVIHPTNLSSRMKFFRLDGDVVNSSHDPVFGEIDPSVHVPGEGTADGSDEELAAFGMIPPA